MLWPLRDVRTADVSITELSDGRRQIIIDHAEMNGVTPAMLAWWYGTLSAIWNTRAARILAILSGTLWTTSHNEIE